MKTTNYLKASITILCVIFSFYLKAQFSPSSWNQQSNPPHKQAHQKAVGDTLFYEDFSNQNLAGWSTNSLVNPAFLWQWASSTTAPGGQYSRNIGPLLSTTSINGFIMLPSDSFNSINPSAGPSWMRSSISSNAIPIEPVVNSRIEFQQYARYCCNPAQLKFEISTDSLNWVSFPAVSILPNQVTSNGQLMSIDLGASIAAAESVYLRFNQDSAAQYFWMIDDVVLKEEEGSGIVLDSAIFDPYRDHGLNQHYSIVPTCFTSFFDFKAIAKNYGTNDHTNVRLEVEIYHDSSLSGGAGLGRLATISSTPTTLLEDERKVLTASIGYTRLTYGYCTAYLKLLSDSVNELQSLAMDTIRFTLSDDSTYARDYGQFDESIGPLNYHLPQNGDIIGVITEIDSIFFSSILTSLSVYIANDSANLGVAVSPRAYQKFGDSISTSYWAGSPFSYTIQQLDTWLTVPFFPPIMLQPGVYVTGLEQTNSPGAQEGMVLGRDKSAEGYSWETTTYVYLNSGTNPDWRGISAMPGIRKNEQSLASGPCLFVGMNEEKESIEDFNLFPNPTQSEVFFTPLSNATDLRVRDVSGKLVAQFRLKKGQSRIDLDRLDSGIYFLSFDDGERQIVKKVVIQP